MLLEGAEILRIEAPDPRSDDRRRIIDLVRDAVTIRRVVAGVSMAIRLDAAAYRSVTLSAAGSEKGRSGYAVRLTHRDPDLAVSLGEHEDRGAAEDLWREWAQFLSLPARIEGIEAGAGSEQASSLPPIARRRASAVARRRPRFLARRKPGNATAAIRIEDDPLVLFYGWKPGR